jgi:hypothetical protein
MKYGRAIVCSDKEIAIHCESRVYLFSCVPEMVGRTRRLQIVTFNLSILDMPHFDTQSNQLNAPYLHTTRLVVDHEKSSTIRHLSTTTNCIVIIAHVDWVDMSTKQTAAWNHHCIFRDWSLDT